MPKTTKSVSIRGDVHGGIITAGDNNKINESPHGNKSAKKRPGAAGRTVAIIAMTAGVVSAVIAILSLVYMIVANK